MRNSGSTKPSFKTTTQNVELAQQKGKGQEHWHHFWAEQINNSQGDPNPLAVSYCRIAKRGLPPPEAGQPGPFSLGAPGRLTEHLKAAGFVSMHVVEAPLRFASAEECVRWRREASGTMQQMLSGLDGDPNARCSIRV